MSHSLSFKNFVNKKSWGFPPQPTQLKQSTSFSYFKNNPTRKSLSRGGTWK
jgi:hypothetical protein